MQFITAILIGAASLAAAAPLEKASTPMGKRTLDTSNCGLQMYAKVSQRASQRNFSYLKADSYPAAGTVFRATPGDKVMVSCQGKAAVWLNVDPDVGHDDEQIYYSPQILGAQISDTYTDCYGGKPGNSEDPKYAVNAIQYWGKGYNLLFQGNANCDDFKSYDDK